MLEEGEIGEAGESERVGEACPAVIETSVMTAMVEEEPSALTEVEKIVVDTTWRDLFAEVSGD